MKKKGLGLTAAPSDNFSAEAVLDNEERKVQGTQTCPESSIGVCAAVQGCCLRPWLPAGDGRVRTEATAA